MGDPLVQAIVLVTDLAAARRSLEKDGFHVDDGGRHPGRGTANLIVAFGTQYLELLAVVDRDEAMSSAQGRPVLAALGTRGPGLARWSVEVSDIASTGRRLGLPVERRQRVRPDGVVIGWRSVGVDESWGEPWRCAFMAWDDQSTHPARTSRSHPNGVVGFERLTVAVPDVDVATQWSGTVPEGVQLVAAGGGPAGPVALVAATRSGSVDLGRLESISDG
jgi:glyoxalase-like protein